MPTHGQFANPITPSQSQSPCKLFIQPFFGGRFLIQIPTAGRWASQPGARSIQPSFGGCIRHRNAHHHAENRRRAVSYVSTGLACLPRDANAHTSTAEERLQRHPPRRISSRSFFGCKLTVDGGRFRMATKQKKRDNTLRVVSPYNSI